MPMRYFGARGRGGRRRGDRCWRSPRRTACSGCTTSPIPFKDAQGTGYHTVEGMYALASGGIFGVGLGQGTSKYGWVPNANSDYVFAIIGEELGLLGCLAVLGLFALFAYTGMRIARRSADPFVRLVAGAATVWICGQAVINIGYVTGAAAGHRHPAAVHLCRWHVAARLVLRAGHAGLLRPARGAGRDRGAARTTAWDAARACSAGCTFRCPGRTSRRKAGREPALRNRPLRRDRTTR